MTIYGSFDIMPCLSPQHQKSSFETPRSQLTAVRSRTLAKLWKFYQARSKHRGPAKVPRFLRQISAMAALATYLAVLSRRADELLEKHHQDLFDLGLDVSFNRATLATKYWLPLPGRDDPTYAHEDEFPHDESDEQLFSALRECERILERFETAALSKLHEMYAVP